MPGIAKTLQTLVLAAAVVALLPAMPVSSAPPAGVAGGTVADANVTDANARERSAVIRTQGIYFGYGRGYRGYGGYYGPGPYYGGYYRPHYYAPPPVTYYETRPYESRPPERAYGDDAVARCASRFKSFDPRTGTYVTYDGEERLCPYLR